jgi:hypothetical protein
MATYKALRGVTIRTVAGDISPVALGDIWYNSAARKIKVGQTAAGAWAAGTALPAATNNQAVFGTQSATMNAGGYTPATPGVVNTCQTYDGSSWTEVGDLSASKYGRRGCGTTAAGLVFGGVSDSGLTESWDGSSWTEIANLNVGRFYVMAAGTATAGLATGGHEDPPVAGVDTEEFNGTSWTETGDLTTGRNSGAGGGIQTAALVICGNGGSNEKTVEQYDGSSWTEIADLNVARNYMQGTSAGSVTAFLGFGGYISAVVATTEEWDGTSWTEVADLSTARGGGGGSGTATSGLLVGGESPRTSAVEEWTGPATAAATVTSS